MSTVNPVLLVHGIWDTGARFKRMKAHLAQGGFEHVHALTFKPNDGSARIETLAAQVRDEVEALRQRTGAARVDVVGFSMGALVSRTYIAMLGGDAHVARFISISGPHAGTWNAHVLGAIERFEGVRDMKRGSDFLQRLEAASLGKTETHVIYTPLDLMILPPSSSELREAKTTTRIASPVHRFVIDDARVLRRVSALLRGGA